MTSLFVHIYDTRNRGYALQFAYPQSLPSYYSSFCRVRTMSGVPAIPLKVSGIFIYNTGYAAQLAYPLKLVAVR